MTAPNPYRSFPELRRRAGGSGTAIETKCLSGLMLH